MNREDYVSLEVAKMLKEKGFPQEYNVGTICRLQNEANPYYEDTRMIVQSDIENAWCIFNEVYPTLYEAQKWIREKQNFHIDIEKQSEGWVANIYDISVETYIIECPNSYMSYEEALNNGILEALKLI